MSPGAGTYVRISNENLAVSSTSVDSPYCGTYVPLQQDHRRDICPCPQSQGSWHPPDRSSSALSTNHHHLDAHRYPVHHPTLSPEHRETPGRRLKRSAQTRLDLGVRYPPSRETALPRPTPSERGTAANLKRPARTYVPPGARVPGTHVPPLRDTRPRSLSYPGPSGTGSDRSSH